MSIELMSPREREYFVASWLGTFSVMKAIGGSEEYVAKSTSFEKVNIPIFLACRSLAGEEIDFLSEMENASARSYMSTTSVEVNWGEHLGIIGRDGDLAELFGYTYKLFSDNEMHRKAFENEPISRLGPTISFHADYHIQRILNRNLVDTRVAHDIDVAHREIDFNIGLEDPDRI